MDQEMTFSLSYEQLTRFAEKRIRECNLDSHGVTYLCESAKAGAVLIFWHELAINGYTSMNAIKPRSTGQTCAPPAVVWRMPAGCVPCALRTCSWQWS